MGQPAGKSDDAVAVAPGASAGPRPDAVLITGATGFVGGQVLCRYLEQTDRPLELPVRATDRAEARDRIDEVLAGVYGDDHPFRGSERISAWPADLEREHLGLDAEAHAQLAARLADVIHCAASVTFSLPLEEARSINVGGTRHALALARAAPQLRRFVHLSTTYVSGRHEGTFCETDLDIGQEPRNSYEQTKLEAEQVVHAATDEVDVRVVRLGIVVGEHHSGWTPAFNVLYYPVKLFAKGRNPPLIPARGATPIDAVPVDYVADAIVALTGHEGPSGETFHLVSAERSMTIGEVLEAGAERFGRRKPILMPLWLYQRTIGPIVRLLYDGDHQRQLDTAGKFLPYFNMHQHFDATNARRVLKPQGIRAPDVADYFGTLMDFAVRADWGKEPITRSQARADAGVPETDQAPAQADAAP